MLSDVKWSRFWMKSEASWKGSYQVREMIFFSSLWMVVEFCYGETNISWLGGYFTSYVKFPLEGSVWFSCRFLEKDFWGNFGLGFGWFSWQLADRLKKFWRNGSVVLKVGNSALEELCRFGWEVLLEFLFSVSFLFSSSIMLFLFLLCGCDYGFSGFGAFVRLFMDWKKGNKQLDYLIPVNLHILFWVNC